MHYLGRAIRLATKYRWTLTGIVSTALVVAVLWGGNIGAMFPVIKVALRGDSLQSWIAQEIEEVEHELDEGQLTPTQQRQFSRHFRILTTVRPWVERWFPTTPFRTVVLVIGAVVVSTIVKGIFVFCNTLLLARLVQMVIYDLRREFFHHALRRDMASFGAEGTSGMMSRFHADIGILSNGIEKLFGNAIREPLKMISCLIGAALISWRLLLLSLILTPLTAWLVKLLAGSIRRANRRAMEEISTLFGVITETFDGIQTVQANNLEPQARQRFRRVSRECLRKSMKIAFYNSLTKPITEILGITVICVALLAGAHLVLNQETHLFGIAMTPRPLSQTSLLIFFGFLIGATEPARKMTEVFHAIQGATAASERLFPLLDTPSHISSPQHPRRLPRAPAPLVFDRVDFAYRPQIPVLREIELTIEPGETVAIMGPNGCGKSTLVHLLPRFIDPDRGEIWWGDVNLRDARLRELRERIGFVAQSPLLFDDTIASNIRGGSSHLTDADIIEAARTARVDQFVRRLEDGYNTRVGVLGRKLSGGQRQRIALARAIARRPDILILDEATSQIDLESEQLIHETLDEFARDRTVLMITHRLSSLSIADRIIVMNQGQVCDRGTHTELIDRCEVYQRLQSSPRAA